MISVDDAKRLVLEHAEQHALGEEEVPLASAVGRVLAKDVVADTSIPLFDSSAMDGYAVRSRDTSGASDAHHVMLEIVGESVAGAGFPGMLQSGQAVKIMTGAPLPGGADSVLMLEKAVRREARIRLADAVPPGKHVRRAGEDVAQSDVALGRGEQVRVRHLGLLASVGASRLTVCRAPSVSLLATGSELVDIDTTPGPGHIRNSNSVVLTAMLSRLGIVPRTTARVGDEPSALRDALSRALRSDVAIISGGVSVGERDLVKPLLRELGMETIFWRVNMKPGKPLLFGRVKQPHGDRWTYIFGLPGNPISCVVGQLMFIEPFLLRIMGRRDVKRPRARAVLRGPVRKSDSRRHFVTVRLDALGAAGRAEWAATPTAKQGSAMLSALAQADGFADVPAECEGLQTGDEVEVIRFDD